MKLLFDQHISFRIAVNLRPYFPECVQVRELNLEDKSDRELWDFARENNYIIDTFDADFYDLVTLYGHPPKVVWLRIGNTRTDALISILKKHAETIKAFILNDNYSDIGCLKIDL